MLVGDFVGVFLGWVLFGVLLFVLFVFVCACLFVLLCVGMV